MAEVLGPIGSTSTMTILHPQDAFQPPNQQGLTAARRQMPRNSMYNPQLTGLGYRGPSSVPISPYAFQSTPQLRHDVRTNPAPTFKQPINVQAPYIKPPYQDSSASSASSASSSSNRSAGGPYALSKDDSVLGTRQRHSYVDNRVSHNMAGTLSTPDLPLVSQEVKPSPDRYRRISRNMENAPFIHQGLDSSPRIRPVSAPFISNEDQRILSESLNAKRFSLGHVPRNFEENNVTSNAARYKRRSGIGRVDSSTSVNSVPSPVPVIAPAPTWSQVVAGRHNFQGPLPPPVQPVRPPHIRSNSFGDNKTPPIARPPAFRHSSYGPSRSPLSVESRPKTAPSNPIRPQQISSPPVPPPSIVQERPRTANPTLKAPEPKPDFSTAPARPQTAGAEPTTQVNSIAVQQLSAVSEKNAKSMKTRLRRAFSFSSSSELRKATAENNMAAERAKLRKEKFDNDTQSSVDASIAAKQEANGLGESIYTHQGDFAASTDNISISSTASSASIMLRKMGKGMKKSTRNLRNLFRSKSSASKNNLEVTTAETSGAITEVSLVTVEAERDRINLNDEPLEKPVISTSNAKPERNSVDSTERPSSPNSATGEVRSRKSIIGGDRERAEVLAAVRKGILKRGPGSTSSSPSIVQSEIIPAGENSAPATPADGSVSEYFGGNHADAHTSTRSLPTLPRNISFNSKVQFFDVWSSSDYDRRGEVATCNRLTPLLAQQIKEELNTFKMEMEVHEDSKPHTHFF